MADDAKTLFQAAIVAFNKGDMFEVEKLLAGVLRQQPKNFDALNLFAIVLMLSQRYAEAEPYLKSALNLKADNDATLSNYGLVLKALNRPQEALQFLTRALAINSANALTWHNRGTTLYDLGRYEDATADFEKAGSLEPRLSDSFCSKGNSLWHLGRYDEAFAAYDKALALKPDSAEPWLGRSNVFNSLKRYDEAIAANDSAIALKPDLAEVWLGRGNIFSNLKRHDDAFTAYDKALAFKPGLAEAWLGRGNVFSNLKRYDDAFAAYDKALALKPNLAETWLGRGNVFRSLKRFDDAFAAYDKALALKPSLDGVEGMRLHVKMQLCNWKNLKEEISNLTGLIKCNKPSSPPFDFLSLSESPDDQLRCAEAWVTAKCPGAPRLVRKGAIYNHDKIRLGYVSADFHKHATAYLMAEVFELHDKTRFEINAYSLGPDDNSGIRKRLTGSFSKFVDCREWPDSAVSRAIIDDEIDILVDLKGFTQDSRMETFASRSAPIQVNYLGYPGTMGAPYIDYIIGDKTLFAFADGDYYTEKLVQLPHSYQPNDRKRLISKKIFSREECSLPKEAFVFCSFNNSFKITPDTFDSWMRILSAVERSVLWILAEDRATIVNLKREAETRGVDPSRLVLAARMESADHLARHRLADLFLDSLPYNAHTTASDALWAGLPILTQIGNTFAGRVAASLLNAIGLPELITRSRVEYESLAIELALNRERLNPIKEKLSKNRLTAALFDAPRYTKHLEAAYEAMYRRHTAGLPPDHIEIEA